MTQQHETPHDLQLEAEVLGFLLSGKDPLAVLGDLSPSDSCFHSALHRQVFRIAKEHLERGPRVNLIDISRRLGTDQEFLQRGGKRFLEELRGIQKGSHHAQDAAQALHDMARRRELIEACTLAAGEAKDVSTELDSVESSLHAALRNMADSVGQSSPETAPEMTDSFLEYIEAISAGEGPTLKTGFLDLDHYSGGLGPGEVIILGGCTGTGKTALALNIGSNATANQKTVGVFSMEMPREQLLGRVFAAQADIDAQSFKTGTFTDAEVQRIHLYADKFRTQPFLISDQFNLRPSTLAAKCRQWRLQYGLDLIIIDYLQLLSPDKAHNSRDREVAEMSRAIKRLAVELQIPILVLAQLSRKIDQRKDKTPLLSDLRESGAIEQDADQVIFLTPWRQDPGAQNAIVKCTLAKGRGNRLGSFELLYVKRHVRFENYAGAYDG